MKPFDRELFYTTNGKRDIRDKLRIYYEGPPGLFGTAFQTVREELFRIVDCAVFFRDPALTTNNMIKLMQELSTMRLIVVVITEEILLDRDLRSEVWYRCAQINQIKVIPIFEDRSVTKFEEQYLRLFGSSQYLILPANKYDESALEMFRQQLKRAVESYTVDAEMIGEIRANFKASVFLSYRRADQEKLAVVMGAISGKRETDEIAQWHDEFLIPGDDFNTTIMTALKRCDVFLLVLTPNILEENNYVITTEYPAAVRLNKPIIAVELEAVDHQRLYEVFGESVADPIDLTPAKGYIDYDSVPVGHWRIDQRTWDLADDKRYTSEEARLRSILVELLTDKLDKEENPEYNYYLGLAYLYGIDFRVNRHQAVIRLEYAAKQDYLPAVEKLYTLNEKWCVQLYWLYLKRYKAQPLPQYARQLLEVAFRYMRYQRLRLRAIAQIKAMYHEVLDLAVKFSYVCEEEAEKNVFEAELGLADCDRRDGDLRKAASACKNLLKQIKATGKDDKSILRRQVRLLGMLAEISYAHHNLLKTEKYCDEALTIALNHPLYYTETDYLYEDDDSTARKHFKQRWPFVPDDDEYTRCCARLYLCKGRIEEFEGYKESAYRRYMDAWSIAESIKKADPSLDNILLLTDCNIHRMRIEKSVRDSVSPINTGVREITDEGEKEIGFTWDENDRNVHRCLFRDESDLRELETGSGFGPVEVNQRLSLLNGILTREYYPNDSCRRENRLNFTLVYAENAVQHVYTENASICYECSPESLKVQLNAFAVAEEYYLSDETYDHDKALKYNEELISLGAYLCKRHKSVIFPEDMKKLYQARARHRALLKKK